MRTPITIISALIAMAAQIQAMDWDTFTFNRNSISPQESTSFSIGYPKGWEPFQDHSQDTKYGLNVGSPHPPGCWTATKTDETTDGSVKEQGHTAYFICQSDGATAAEAAATFFNDEEPTKTCTHKSMTEVKTSAGDSGWLVESESYLIKNPAIAKLMGDAFLERTDSMNELLQSEKDNKSGQKIPAIYHDYFFHSRNLGAIRIHIMTDAANTAWRSQLDHLVLETLRFKSS